LQPDSLAIYYGVPSAVNGANGDINAAINVFDDYDIVVFGDTLQLPQYDPNTTDRNNPVYDKACTQNSHLDHDNTVQIIQALTQTRGTEVYGYISIGGENTARQCSPGTPTPLTDQEIRGFVDAWDAMGVTGVFFDEAGYDFGTSRARQNKAIDYAHHSGLRVFINAFHPEDTFSDEIVGSVTYSGGTLSGQPSATAMNPDGLLSQLRPDDIYLLESFQIISGDFQDPGFWQDRSDKALKYKNLYGTRIATVTGDPGPGGIQGFDQQKFDYAWWSTQLYGFDAMGWGELNFAADSNLPLRTQPTPTVGDAFTSTVVVHDLSTHTRMTSTGTIDVNTTAHTGQFLPGVAQTPASPINVPPEVGLVSWWSGDEDDKKFTGRLMSADELTLDLAGSNDGTLVNGVSYAPGKVEQAFSLDGYNDYISLGTGPSVQGAGPFTVSAWVKTTDSDGVIIQQRDATATGFDGQYVLSVGSRFVAGQEGKVSWATYEDGFGFGFNFSSNALVNDGQFHHIVASRDADGAGHIYIDGVLDSSQSALLPNPNTLKPHNVYVGADIRDQAAYFNGLIDEVQIFNRALTASEIEDIANFTTGPVWPISGTTQPDFGLSSTFGPRLKASQGFRYDWHRGIDIPTPAGTPLHATEDGVVEQAGDVSGFSDRMAQIKHTRPDSSIYYSTYLHLSALAPGVTAGTTIAKGDIIGYSGESGIGKGAPGADPTVPLPYNIDLPGSQQGGFDHLHFEIRDGGKLQKYAVHPLGYLPYRDNGGNGASGDAPSVSISHISFPDPADPTKLKVDVSVASPPEELDFNDVAVTVVDISSGTPVPLAQRSFDINQWNRDYTPFQWDGHPQRRKRSIVEILDTAADYTGVYDGLSDRLRGGQVYATDVPGGPSGVAVSPASFNAATETYTMDVSFFDLEVPLNADNIRVIVTARDIWGHESQASRTLPYLSEQLKLNASDAKVDDGFGTRIAMDGNIMVVGAPGLLDLRLPSTSQGAAYVFNWDGSNWVEQAILTASDGAPGDLFGFHLAIDGNTIVVGALNNQHMDIASGSVIRSGAAYVYQWDGATWKEKQKLVANDAAAGDWFGIALDVSNNRIAVAASKADAAGSNSGAIYVYHPDGGRWVQQAKLVPADAAAGDELGAARGVAIEGDTLVVGALGQDDPIENGGAVYVYQWDGASWNQQQKLRGNNLAPNNYFGKYIGLSGSTLVVGAEGDDDGGTWSGAAYVFEKDGSGMWLEKSKLKAMDAAAGDLLGSVAIEGGRIVAGARYDDDTAPNSGSAYVFEKTGSTWTQTTKLIATDVGPGTNFGMSPAISGDTVALGGPTPWVGQDNFIDHFVEPAKGSIYLFNLGTPPVAQPNTPVGTAVVVQPVDASTGGTPATLAFDQVTAPGVTHVTSSSEGPTPDTGFNVLDTFYDVVTTATVQGFVSVSFEYDETMLAPNQDESTLKLMHYEDTNADGQRDSWVDRTVLPVDTVANIIHGSVSSLSPFAIFAPNDPPTADAGGPYMVDEGGSVMLDGAGSTDPENDLLTYQWNFDYDGVNFDVDAEGMSVVLDASNLDGPLNRSLALRVIDSGNNRDITATALTVNNVAPTANAVTDATTEDSGTFSVDLLDPAVTSDPGPLDILAITGVAQNVSASQRDLAGAFSLVDGVLSFDTNLYNDLASGASELLVFDYVVDDQDGQPNSTSTSTVTITVAGVNDTPTANPDAATTDEDHAVTIEVLANDTDPDTADVLAVDSVTQGMNGQVVVNPDGTVTYTPEPNFAGTDGFTYIATDGHGGHGTATVNIKVNNLPDLSGRVYDDGNENGVDDGEPGIAGVPIRLTGTDDNGTIDRSAVTASDGSYLFTDLRPGTYSLAEVAQPFGYLDGLEAAGLLGGTVGNDVIRNILVPIDAPDAPAYNFGEILAVDLGLVVRGGDGSGFALLGLADTEVEIDKEGSVRGDVGVGPNSDFADELADFKKNILIDGDVFIDPSTDFEHVDLSDITGNIISQSMAGTVIDALAASARATSLTPMQTFPVVGGGSDPTAVTTITGNGGVNVIQIGQVDLSGHQNLVLSGTASDLFIVNVSGSFHLAGHSQVILAGNLDASQILWNLTGSGGDDARAHIHQDSHVFGTVLAPHRKVKLDGHIHGALIGGGEEIAIHGHHGDLANTNGRQFIDFKEQGKPQVLTLRYTADGGPSTSHSQKPSQANVTGAPSTLPAVYIVASDKADAGDASANIYFTGTVQDGATFAIDATAAGLNKLKAQTFVHVFETAGGTLLQTVEFHTSGSEPLAIGDDFGPVELAAYLGYQTDNGRDSNDDPGITSDGHDYHVGGVFSIDYTPFALARTATTPEPVPVPGLSGFVFEDSDNNGMMDRGELPIEGATVTLLDASSATVSTALTDASGRYEFAGLATGTYTIVETQPATLDGGVDALDGKESVGSLGGTVDNLRDSNAIRAIAFALGEIGSGYNFGEVAPAGLSGFVWEDFNNDGEVNFGEKAIENVSIQLTGADDRGHAVSLMATTNAEGFYTLLGLRPGAYKLTEMQPVEFEDGADVVGSVGGDNSANNTLSAIGLTSRLFGSGYNFGERPLAGNTVSAGQTARIGFWLGKNGRKLIKGLNGSRHSTQLSAWLAATYPNMYGATAGDHDLTGMNNDQVAKFYKKLFKDSAKGVAVNLSNDAQVLDSQVMALALATYVTNRTLIETPFNTLDPTNPLLPANPMLVTQVESYGLLVTDHGVGVATFDVGDANRVLFDLTPTDSTVLTVMDILLTTNARSRKGVLYDLNADGVLDKIEDLLRVLANGVYAAVNEQGSL